MGTAPQESAAFCERESAQRETAASEVNGTLYLLPGEETLPANERSSPSPEQPPSRL